jgi:hypothetical protein
MSNSRIPQSKQILMRLHYINPIFSVPLYRFMQTKTVLHLDDIKSIFWHDKSIIRLQIKSHFRENPKYLRIQSIQTVSA